MWYNGHMILAMRQVSAAAPPVRQRAARCAIDGFAKMPLRASIFASWYNCLRRMLLCSLRGLCPQPCLRHGLGIDGLAKMFVRAHIFASWYNSHMMPCGKYRRLRRPCVREPYDVPFNVSEEMPLPTTDGRFLSALIYSRPSAAPMDMRLAAPY